MVVIKDRREVRLGLESTRWKNVFSSMLALPLSSIESSQSEESSSSSMALSSISSSSSVSKTSSSKGCSSLIVRVATSSLNDVCFLFASGLWMLSVNALVGGTFIFGGRELSSSLDEPPKEKTVFFFFCCGPGCRLLSMELVFSLIESSPEDPPRANIWRFLGCSAFDVVAAARSAVGMDDGAVRRGIDRKEELTCEGEKPLTTLVEDLSEAPLTDSEEAGRAERSESSEVNDLDSTIVGVGCCGVVAVC